MYTVNQLPTCSSPSHSFIATYQLNDCIHRVRYSYTICYIVESYKYLMMGEWMITSSPVIIVGAHTVGLAILRAFGGLNIERVVVSYDRKDMGRVSRYISRLVEAPHPEKDPEGFINILCSLADRYPRALLIPASDASLSVISQHKDKLDRYFIVACESWQTTKLFLDKKETAGLATRAGVPAPATRVPKNESEVVHFAEDVSFPCLIKPCQSHKYFDIFHKKMVFCQNKDELMDAYRGASSNHLEVMLQEFIPGKDEDGVNYNAYFMNGEPLVEFTARKVRNAPPQMGSPCVVMSSHEPDVMEYGRKLMRSAGYSGFACTEFKQDEKDGTYKLMEVNARHNLSGLLATGCGLNFPLLQYRHLMLGEIPGQMDYKMGVYWIDLTRDWAYHLRRVIKKEISWTHFSQPYIKSHIFAILDYRDFHPFYTRVKDLVWDGISGKRNIN